MMHLSALIAIVLSVAVRAVNAFTDDEFAQAFREKPFGYALRQVITTPEDEGLSKHFADIDGLELLSPAFLHPENVSAGFANGTSTPVPWQIQDNFLRTLADRNDWMTYANADFTSEEGRSYPYITLSSGYNGSEANDDAKKIRLLIQAHIHGNEPAGEEAVLALLGKMDSNSTWAASVLEKLDITIIPRTSPDGAAYFQRQLARGIDPNRDFAVMNSQQTRNLIKLYGKIDPHIMLDLHETGAAYPLGPENDLARATDVEVSGLSAPNVHRDIRRLEYQLFVQDMYAALRRHDLRTSTYYAGGQLGAPLEFEEVQPSATSGLSQVAMRQAIAVLIESRGVGIGDQHYQRRVGGTLIAITQFVETAAENAEQVYDTIQDARGSFINSTEDILVVPTPRVHEVTWQFINTTQNNSLVELTAPLKNYTMAGSNLTRARPEAYVFARAWDDVAERLRVSGVEVSELNYDFTSEVEALQINASTLARNLTNGIALNEGITTLNYTKEVTIPAGGYWVSTRQVNAAIAFGFLEPENPASMVTHNVVHLVTGEEYPIYRVLN